MRIGSTHRLPIVSIVALWVLTLSWPWELFQRVPVFNFTLVKLAALVIIGTVSLSIVIQPSVTHRLRSGLEAPIILMLIACGLSLLFSVDRAAGFPLLLQYVSYLVLFYALILVIQTPELAIQLGRGFAVSASLVAILAVLCSAAWAFPAIAVPNEYQGNFISSQLRAAIPMRMAATTTDFNQGVLCFVVAIPMALILFLGTRSNLLYKIAGILLGVLLLAGIVVSYSRSSMLALLLMTIVAGITGLRYRLGTKNTVVLFILSLILILPIAIFYHEALLQRFLRGIVTRDASYEARWYVFEVAWSLLPRYFWLGTGLGASDAAIQAVADPVRLQGITIHSVPFKFLMETGILGGVAYFWLWWRLIKNTWQNGVLSRSNTQQILGYTMVCIYAGCFLVMMIQPFMALSLFPLLAAMSCGPLRNNNQQVQLPLSVPPPGIKTIGGTALIVLVLVLYNVIQYQKLGQRLDTYVESLYKAVTAEKNGDWPVAETTYLEAIHSAGYALQTESENKSEVNISISNEAVPLSEYYYYDVAIMVPDFHYLHRVAGLGMYKRDAIALGWLGLARAQIALGKYDGALDAIDKALEIHPDWASAWYYHAEAGWQSDEYSFALASYTIAAQHAEHWVNDAYLQRLNSYNDQIETIKIKMPGYEDQVTAGILQLLIESGRWEEALEIAKATDVLAESFYVLGIAEEIAGNQQIALEKYKAALDIDSTHIKAARRINSFYLKSD